MRTAKLMFLMLPAALWSGCGVSAFKVNPGEEDSNSEISTEDDSSTISSDDSETESESDTGTGVISDSNSEIATESESESDSTADTGDGTDSDSGTDTASDTGEDTGSEPDTGTVDTGTGTEHDSDSATDTEPDTGTGTEADSETASDTSGGTEIYITTTDSDVWHGHGWTGTGTVDGGVISDIDPGDYVLGADPLCVEGVLETDYGSLGLVGFNLNQQKGAAAAGTWMAGVNYTALYFNISQQNTSAILRVELVDEDGNAYCKELVSGQGNWSLTDFKTACWGSSGTALTAGTRLIKLQVYAAGKPDLQVLFNFCVNDIHPV